MDSKSLTPVSGNNVMYTVANKLLQQLIDLLESLPNDRVYVMPSTVMPGGTIGKHSRHIYDHFHLLLLNSPMLKPQSEANRQWTVDFDDRCRDRPMESDPREAVRCFRNMQLKLHEAEDKVPLDSPLLLAATIDPSDKIPKYHMKSSFERELWYCCMHAIHHYASIKAICIEQQIPVANDFGIAPSTTLFHQQHHKLSGHL